MAEEADLRCLSVTQQALLLLQVLNLLLIRRLGNELINVAQIVVRRNIKTGVPLADPVPTAHLIVRANVRAPRSLLVHACADRAPFVWRRGDGMMSIRAQRCKHVARVGKGHMSVRVALKDGSIRIKRRGHISIKLRQRSCRGGVVHGPDVGGLAKSVTGVVIKTHKVAILLVDERIV